MLKIDFCQVKIFLIDIYRHDLYHALRKYAKKFPLPMSGEGGREQNYERVLCLNYITRYSSCKFSSVNGFSVMKYKSLSIHRNPGTM